MKRALGTVLAAAALLFPLIPSGTSWASVPVNCQEHRGDAQIKDSWSGITVVSIHWGVDSCWQMDGTLVRWQPWYTSSVSGLWTAVTCWDPGYLYNPTWQGEGANWRIGGKFGFGPASFCTPGSHPGGCLSIILTPPLDWFDGDLVGCGWTSKSNGGGDFYIHQSYPPLQYGPTYGVAARTSSQLPTGTVPTSFHHTLPAWVNRSLASMPSAQAANLRAQFKATYHLT